MKKAVNKKIPRAGGSLHWVNTKEDFNEPYNYYTKKCNKCKC